MRPFLDGASRGGIRLGHRESVACLAHDPPRERLRRGRRPAPADSHDARPGAVGDAGGLRPLLPPTIEQLALYARQPDDVSRWYRRLNEQTERVTLECGDAFICASERQRDLWLGALIALGRVGAERYQEDHSLRSLVDVVPFGLEPSPPRHDRDVLRGVVDGIELDDLLLIWGGGIWNWFDPLTVIRGVAQLADPGVKLYFLGTRHPNPGMPEMEMTRQAIALAEELGLRGRSVFFNLGWVPYDERASYLLEADIGVSAHFDELETRFAFRTRLLDCFWADLPTITTTGDTLADLVRERSVGRVVEVGDVDGWAQSIAELALPKERERARSGLGELRAELTWPRVVEPLRMLLRGDGAHAARPVTTALRQASYLNVRARLALETRGMTGLVRRALVGLDRRRRGDQAAHPPEVR